MANTRIGNDACRIMKQNQQMTDPGRYTLGVPGPGADLPYVMDPCIRLQKWGANT